MYTLHLKLRSEKYSEYWTMDQIYNLYILVFHFGHQWKFIQQNYFPDKTIDQIRARFTSERRALDFIVDNANCLWEVPMTKSFVQQCLKKLSFFYEKQATIKKEIEVLTKGDLVVVSDVLFMKSVQIGAGVIKKLNSINLAMVIQDLKDILTKM